MARRDRDYRNLLIDTLDGIREIYKTTDTASSPESYNQLVDSVTFLEDILSPYMNVDNATTYNPRSGKEKLEDLHYRIRECMRVAYTVALMPPRAVTEDARQFTPPSLDEDE